MLAMRRIGTPETTPLRLNAPNHPACVRVRKRNYAAAPRLIVIMQEHADGTRPTPQSPYPAEKARGAEIIFRRPWERAVFVLGLVAPTIAAILLLLFWR